MPLRHFPGENNYFSKAIEPTSFKKRQKPDGSVMDNDVKRLLVCLLPWLTELLASTAYKTVLNWMRC